MHDPIIVTPENSHDKRGFRDWCLVFLLRAHNLVPRACDPLEGIEGSGIIRFREESDWPLKWNA